MQRIQSFHFATCEKGRKHEEVPLCLIVLQQNDTVICES
jgi:hypothetical protein